MRANCQVVVTRSWGLSPPSPDKLLPWKARNSVLRVLLFCAIRIIRFYSTWLTARLAVWFLFTCFSALNLQLHAYADTCVLPVSEWSFMNGAVSCLCDSLDLYVYNV
jgi:hypothetical protein